MMKIWFILLFGVANSNEIYKIRPQSLRIFVKPNEPAKGSQYQILCDDDALKKWAKEKNNPIQAVNADCISLPRAPRGRLSPHKPSIVIARQGQENNTWPGHAKQSPLAGVSRLWKATATPPPVLKINWTHLDYLLNKHKSEQSPSGTGSVIYIQNHSASSATMKPVQNGAAMSPETPHPGLAFLLIVLAGIIFLLCSLGNGLILVVTLRRRLYRNTSHSLQLSLVIGHIILAAMLLPLEVHTWLQGGRWGFGMGICRGFSTLQPWLIAGLSWTVVCIAIDRNLNTIRNSFDQRFKLRQCQALILVVWVFGSLISIPELLYSSNVDVSSFELRNASNSCIITPVHVCVPLDSSPSLIKMNSLFKVLMSYVLPMTMTFALYVRVARSIGISRQTTSLLNGDAHGIYMSTSEKPKRKIIIMMGIISSVFFLLWLPYMVFTALRDFGYVAADSGGSRIFLFLLASAAGSTIPIIYCSLAQPYYKSLLHLLWCLVPCARGKLITTPAFLISHPQSLRTYRAANHYDGRSRAAVDRLCNPSLPDQPKLVRKPGRPCRTVHFQILTSTHKNDKCAVRQVDLDNNFTVRQLVKTAEKGRQKLFTKELNDLCKDFKPSDHPVAIIVSSIESPTPTRPVSKTALNKEEKEQKPNGTLNRRRSSSKGDKKQEPQHYNGDINPVSTNGSIRRQPPLIDPLPPHHETTPTNTQSTTLTESYHTQYSDEPPPLSPSSSHAYSAVQNQSQITKVENWRTYSCANGHVPHHSYRSASLQPGHMSNSPTFTIERENHEANRTVERCSCKTKKKFSLLRAEEEGNTYPRTVQVTLV